MTHLFNDTDITAIAKAIRTKKGTQNTMTVGQMPDEIASIPTGGGTEIQPKDVNFYDYDGTVLYAYTLAEAQALTALPELPEGPSGYTASSWTENLTTVKNLTYPFNIGVNYTTSKTGTEFDIVLSDDKEVSCYLFSGGTIDWGDGYSDTASSDIFINHTYAISGEYTVTISAPFNTNLRGRLLDPYTQSTVGSCPILMFTKEFYQTSNYDHRIISSLVKRIRTGNYLYLGGASTITLFSYCSLESVMITMNNSITKIIVNSMFKDCYNLKFISIPSSVNTIADRAFANNYNLKTCVLPTSITTIDSYAFSNCYNIESFSSTVTSIVDYTFSYCCSLKDVYLPYVTRCTFSSFEKCYSLKEINLPSCTILSRSVFNSCDSLTTFNMPSLITLGQSDYGSVFYGCYSLQTVVIPSTVTFIGYSAFENCYSLQSVTIPASVTSIEGRSFYNCSYLNEVKVFATTPPTLGGNVFGYNYSTRKIYVPYSADHSILNAYKTASGWSTYANDIEELPEN